MGGWTGGRTGRRAGSWVGGWEGEMGRFQSGGQPNLAIWRADQSGRNVRTANLAESVIWHARSQPGGNANLVNLEKRAIWQSGI